MSVRFSITCYPERVVLLDAFEIGPCPSCQGRIAAQDPGDIDPVIVHALPTCDYFDRTPVDRIVSDLYEVAARARDRRLPADRMRS